MTIYCPRVSFRHIESDHANVFNHTSVPLVSLLIFAMPIVLFPMSCTDSLNHAVKGGSIHQTVFHLRIVELASLLVSVLTFCWPEPLLLPMHNSSLSLDKRLAPLLQVLPSSCF